MAPGSLTARLIQVSQGRFQVRLLSQARQRPTHEEMRLPGMGGAQAPVREVLLLCAGVPVVFAHTVIRPGAMRRDWPFLRGLGNRSLGGALFTDRRVSRGGFVYAILPPCHPLHRQARAAVPELPAHQPLHARRSCFWRAGGAMWVTEVFLPAILDYHQI